MSVANDTSADLAARGYASIETDVWENRADKPGLLFRVRSRTVREVTDDIKAALGESPDGAEEYLSTGWENIDRPWPAGRMAVFAVRGGSEGQYVHLSVIRNDDGKEDVLLLGKTLREGMDGRDAAWRCARRIADLLGV